MHKCAVVIPCFNCGIQVTRVLNSLIPYSENIQLILIVDNKSSSENQRCILEFLKTFSLQDKIRFYENNVNLGLGASFKRAWINLKKLGIKQMIFLHGDNQANIGDYFNFPEKTPTMLGARFMNKSLITNYSFKRIFVNKFFNKILSSIYCKKVFDIGSGLNIFNLDSIPDDVILNLNNKITYDLELLMYILKNNQQFSFFPISWKCEDETSSINEFKVGIDLLKIIFFNTLFIKKSKLFFAPEEWTLINEKL